MKSMGFFVRKSMHYKFTEIEKCSKVEGSLLKLYFGVDWVCPHLLDPKW
jgi:hypothetical protein